MKVIGVTGGVGSGKSSLLKRIGEEYSCVILYADDAAKEIEKPGRKCYDELVSLLGKEILDEEGQIHKGKMSARIFGDDDLREKVNNIIHPGVREYILARIREEKEAGKVDWFFLEAALLIECGYLAVVDEMWYIHADRKVRRERLKKGRGYTDEKIDAIMNSQLGEEEFRHNCHFTVDNSGTLEEAMSQVRAHLGTE